MPVLLFQADPLGIPNRKHKAISSGNLEKKQKTNRSKTDRHTIPYQFYAIRKTQKSIITKDSFVCIYPYL